MSDFFCSKQTCGVFSSSQHGLAIRSAMARREKRNCVHRSISNSSSVPIVSRSHAGAASKLPLKRATFKCRVDDSEEHSFQILNRGQKSLEFLPGNNYFGDRQTHYSFFGS